MLGGGGAEPIHEHEWQVRVELEGEELGSDGLLVDFVKVKKLLAEIADRVRGQDLGKVPGMSDKQASAENVAGYFYEQLEGQFGLRGRLVGVSVQEAAGCWASYRA